MKPLQHAQISAYRYGGNWQDFYAFHDWFDQSKKVFPSMQHRMFLHSDFGCALATQIFGEKLTSHADTEVATAVLAHDHQVEDLGRVILLTEWLENLDEAALCRAEQGALRSQLKLERALVTVPTESLALRYGGVANDFAPLVAFFDEPARYCGQDKTSRWVLHNSFGIYLAEELFGPVLTLSDDKLISTRSIGEDIVKARLGFIPSAAVVASRIQLRPWMVGTEVGEGLKSRPKLVPASSYS